MNNRCNIPERTTLPSVQDLMRMFPLRNTTETLVVIRESDQGLLGFTLDNELYFYKVAPFGATFSAFHWTHEIIRLWIQTWTNMSLDV
jgi:hypothetical protein